MPKRKVVPKRLLPKQFLVPPQFHKKVNQKLVGCDEEQTVEEFIDMGNREPNEEGTGT